MCHYIQLPFLFKICANDFLILSLGVLLTVLLYQYQKKMKSKKSDETAEQTEHKSILLGSLNTKRTLTDLPSLISFSVFILVWILISIYAYYNDDSAAPSFIYHCLKIFKDTYNQIFHSVFSKLIYNKSWDDFQFFRDTPNLIRYSTHNDNLYNRSYTSWKDRLVRKETPYGTAYHEINGYMISFGYIVLCCIVSFAFFALLRYFTKLLVWITIVVKSILFISILCIIGYCIYAKLLGFVAILPVIIIIIIYSSIISAFKKLDFEIFCHFIHESYEIALFFPSSLLYILIQFTLQLLVIISSASVFEQLQYITVTFYSSVPYHIYFFHAINCCACLWVNYIIMDVGKMILTTRFANWWYIKDKHFTNIEIETPSLMQCSKEILRYHLGTVAYGTSLLSMIPIFHIIWKNGRGGLKELYKQPVLILSWITIFMTFPSNALTMSAIYGKEFYKSAKDFYVLSIKFPFLLFTTNIITECVILTGTLLIFATPYLTGLALFKMLKGAQLSRTQTDAIVLSSFIFFAISLMLFAVFRAAVNAVRFCYLKNYNLNEHSSRITEEVCTDDTIREVDV